MPTSARAWTHRPSSASTPPSRSPTPRRSPRRTTSTTTSTCSATRSAAGTPSTSARRGRTAARTSAAWTAPTCRARPSTPTPARTRPTPPRPRSEKRSRRGRTMAVMRYREALNAALREEMVRDENVMLMGEDIGVFNGAFKVTAGLLDEFGEKRVRDTPISENTIVGMGVGAAMTGLRPVVELMTINFSLLAMDQIVNHAATIRYMFGGQVKVPLVVRMPQGAGHQLGPTHSHSWEALYLHVPGLLVAVPTTAADAKGLLKSAIRDDNPVVFIEHEYLYGQRGEVPDDDDFTVRFGVAAIRREGSDVTVVGISRMVLTAARAAKTLSAEHGIEAEVIDPRTLRPLDLDTILASVRRTNRCVIVEEGWPHGGVGANLAALIQEQAFDDLDAPVQRVTGADVPMPYSKALEELAFPHEPQIVDAVLATFRDRE
ncbi:MAG TPA: pyruvate dehydrogenase complex E1 component subunit beta [Solirubrobacteraceae bacterium]|nr:pyruvate dehydrogenase complex E1 component subunit beta [Solirubrobacteraceae bacterium]